MLTRPALRVCLGVGLVLLAVGSTACDRVPWPGRGASMLVASGTLEADETMIAARVSAPIAGLPRAAGAMVSAGDILVRLDDEVPQLAIRQAPDPSTLNLTTLQLQDYTLRSPIRGVVTRVNAHAGEMALPGQVLLAVADLSTLKLTLYVREEELVRVRIGQRITLTADPYPGRTFAGIVTSINQRAEFTPRNVQTRTDRLNLVFGVQATVTNEDGALKPGMPADATFEAAQATP